MRDWKVEGNSWKLNEYDFRGIPKSFEDEIDILKLFDRIKYTSEYLVKSSVSLSTLTVEDGNKFSYSTVPWQCGHRCQRSR